MNDNFKTLKVNLSPSRPTVKFNMFLTLSAHYVCSRPLKVLFFFTVVVGTPYEAMIRAVILSLFLYVVVKPAVTA